jgi:hypothetical protein
MSDGPFITLTEAAKMTGRAKSSVSRALESGRMSYVARDPVTGTYRIDPAEALRVFPVRATTPLRDQDGTEDPQEGNPRNPPRTPENADLRARLARLEALNEGAERERRRMEEHIEDLRSRLERADRERDQLQALLAAPRAEAATPPRWGFWGFLRRRTPPA